MTVVVGTGVVVLVVGVAVVVDVVLVIVGVVVVHVLAVVVSNATTLMGEGSVTHLCRLGIPRLSLAYIVNHCYIHTMCSDLSQNALTPPLQINYM